MFTIYQQAKLDARVFNARDGPRGLLSLRRRGNKQNDIEDY